MFNTASRYVWDIMVFLSRIVNKITFAGVYTYYTIIMYTEPTCNWCRCITLYSDSEFKRWIVKKEKTNVNYSSRRFPILVRAIRDILYITMFKMFF